MRTNPGFYSKLDDRIALFSAIENYFRVACDPDANLESLYRSRDCDNILHLGLISLFDVAGASATADFRFHDSHDEYIDVDWYERADWRSTMKWFFSDGT